MRLKPRGAGRGLLPPSETSGPMPRQAHFASHCGRPRRQGQQFVQLRDAGDPDESPVATMIMGATESRFLDRASTKPRLLYGMIDAVASQSYPHTVVGGVSTVDVSLAIKRPRRQNQHTHAWIAAAELLKGFVPSGAVHLAAIDCQECAVDEWQVDIHEAHAAGSTSSNGARVVMQGAGEILSRAWTVTARARGSTAVDGWSRAVECRSRVRRRSSLKIFRRHPGRARTRPCAESSLWRFTTGQAKA